MLTELATLNDVALARILHGRLLAAGIAAHLFDEGFSGLLGGGFPGIRLMVAEPDLVAARELLGLPENEAGG